MLSSKSGKNTNCPRVAMKYSIGDIREDEVGEEEALNHLAVSPWTFRGVERVPWDIHI